MACERLDLVGQEFRVSTHGMEENLRVLRAVDITEDCPNRQRPEGQILLSYALSADGVIVQLLDCEGGIEKAARCEWYIHQLEHLPHELLALFNVFAEWYKVSSEELRRLMCEHAPAQDEQAAAA